MKMHKRRFVFYQIIKSLVVHTVERHVNIVLSRQDDHRNIRMSGFNIVQCFHAIHGCVVHAIQVVIQNNYIGLMVQIFDAQLSGGVGFDDKTSIAEVFNFQQFKENGVVVH